MRDSKIGWTHHTFNPWWGCEKIAPECKNCYADAFAKRTGNTGLWGPGRTFRTFAVSVWLVWVPLDDCGCLTLGADRLRSAHPSEAEAVSDAERINREEGRRGEDCRAWVEQVAMGARR